MTVGDLFDLLEERLKSGEFSRADDLDAEGYALESIEKRSGDLVRLYIEDDLPDCSNCFEESDNQEILKLTEQLDNIRELLDEAEEINMSNYDIDQVGALNNFYIEVSQVLEGGTDAAEES